MGNRRLFGGWPAALGAAAAGMAQVVATSETAAGFGPGAAAVEAELAEGPDDWEEQRGDKHEPEGGLDGDAVGCFPGEAVAVSGDDQPREGEQLSIARVVAEVLEGVASGVAPVGVDHAQGHLLVGDARVQKSAIFRGDECLGVCAGLIES